MFNIELEQHNRLLLIVWDSSLRNVWRHAITILIHHEMMSPLLWYPQRCRYVKIYYFYSLAIQSWNQNNLKFDEFIYIEYCVQISCTYYHLFKSYAQKQKTQKQGMTLILDSNVHSPTLIYLYSIVSIFTFDYLIRFDNDFGCKLMR